MAQWRDSIRKADRLPSIEGYAPGEERPLGGYAMLLAVYATSVVAAGALVRRRGSALPERPSAADLALLTVATHLASRLVAKDAVTAVVRAPFTRYEEPAGEGEVNESVRGRGLAHAIGELLACPFCLALWIATALAFGMLFAPRSTRWAASVLSAVAGSDYLQFAFTALKERS
jgi:hypothetical protein